MKGSGGFSLIELIIVIAIFGIILAIVIPNLGDMGCMEAGNQTNINGVVL